MRLVQARGVRSGYGSDLARDLPPAFEEAQNGGAGNCGQTAQAPQGREFEAGLTRSSSVGFASLKPGAPWLGVREGDSFLCSFCLAADPAQGKKSLFFETDGRWSIWNTAKRQGTP